jgi:hypothetical protein
MRSGKTDRKQCSWPRAWLRSRLPRRHPARHRLNPALLPLEDRRLLATFHVTSTAGDGSIGTLAWAVQQANAATSPTTIDFNLGSAPATITLSQGALELSNTDQPTTITGPGANLLSISGGGTTRVFQIDPQVTASLSGLEITGGSTTGTGGGLLNHGKASLEGCTLSGNTAAYGGGLLSDGKLALDDCTISGNSASIEGGGLWTSGGTNLDQCTIIGNSSEDLGGGVFGHSAALALTGCTISGNTARRGAGVYNQEMATLAGCTISGNTAPTSGGGLVTGIVGFSTLFACTISGNFSRDGAGLENDSQTTLTNCTISGNLASGSGGAISNSGTAALAACTITGNVAAVSGGGLDNHDFLESRGTATLTDTIVAGNTAADGSPSEIGGPSAVGVTGSFNLIGPGGPGGIRAGTQGNVVLANLAGLGLALLDHYGGPTETIALLPGSPALGAGTPINGLVTDQRGEPLDLPVDIGAFQSQGFVIRADPGTTPQSAPTGEAFANSLSVTVAARNPTEPVAGGIVSFTINRSATGAAAELSAFSAVIAGDRRAQVTATANAITGTSTVTASTAGSVALAQFTLTNLENNLVHLPFTGLTDQSIPFGTPAVTFTGTLAQGTRAPASGETVAVTLAGVTQQATIGAGGAFSTTFATAGLTVSGSPYSVTFRYRSDGTFASQSSASVLAMTPATPVVSVTDSGGVFTGAAFAASAAVAGSAGLAAPSLEGIAPALFYYSGTHTAAELPGLMPLAGAPSQAGTYTVVARFPGSADYAAAESAAAGFTIARSPARVVLARHPGFKKKQLVSIGLSAEVQPALPGRGIATGTFTFMLKKKTFAILALRGGAATLNLKSKLVLGKVVTVVYSGDRNFQPGHAATPKLTRASLRSPVRMLRALVERMST